MKEHEFEKWIEASHNTFKIFEGELIHVYSISRRCVKDWYDKGSFNVSNIDIEILKRIKENFNYEAFGIESKCIKYRIDENFTELIEQLKNNNENIGFGIAPYLFTWNFQRFKEYFKSEQFDLKGYFENLGNNLNPKKDELKKFYNKKIYSDEINEEEIKGIFNDINSKLHDLGIGQNEYVGVAKLLHIFAPYYFPLIDNPIAKAVGLKERENNPLDADKYIKWMKCLKKWISNYNEEKIKSIECRYCESILKLIDEGLYVMSSINLKRMGLIKDNCDE